VHIVCGSFNQSWVISEQAVALNKPLLVATIACLVHLQVVTMNDYQKQRFVERVISAMFNTVARKRLAIFGFAFKKDTGDTRETPTIDVCRGLLADGAKCVVYDPKVTPIQVG
jgi:UDP-glucose 6-dehydrogenase